MLEMLFGRKMSFRVLLLVLSGLSCRAEEDVLDVLEGQDVVLKCRFSPELSSTDSALSWIRSRRTGEHDNVVIGDRTFSLGYAVNYAPGEGIYDLIIKGTSYERDNGNFECRKVESGSGKRLHTSTVELVVLLPPGAPNLSPANPILTESRPFNISCASTGGSPPPVITWFKNNEPGDFNVVYEASRTRDQPSISTLIVSPSKEDDGSEFKCSVWNRAIAKEQTMEEKTTIFVNYFPRITVGPENPVRVERDETAELHCDVDSKPSVTEVKWMRNDRFINVNFKHLIPRANLKDAGTYKCQADNGLGEIGEQELELDVLFAPEVSVPAMREFGENEEILIHCNVTANPPAHSVVWSKADDPEFRQVGSPLRLPGSNSAAQNNGLYTCTATNVIQPTNKQKMERTGNATISIAVKHAPGATFILPEKPTVLEGGRVTMECGSKPPGYPLPEITWWKDERSIVATGSSFTLDAARLDSGGKYYCQATNIMGTGSVAETLLQVYQEPKLDIKLKSTIVKRSGDTGYHIACSAIGKPKPRIMWFKNGVEIDGSTSNLYQITVPEQEVRSNEAYNVLSTLKFVGPDRISKDHLMATDRGEYTCRFENEVGVAESVMLLRIEHSPVVRHQHNKVAADQGETAVIACRMQAYPSIRFEWSKGNSLLTDRPPHSMTMTELGDDIFEGVLTISHVDDSTYGEYACKASNQLGAQKTLITLQPKGKPEKPRDARAVEVFSDSLMLEWDEGFNGGYNKTTYNVEYKKIGGGSAQYSDCRWRNPCNITGLEQNTKYQFKVKAVNIRGDSDWSRDISVTTAVDVTKIPQPEEIFYESSSKTVFFNVVNYPMGLVAKIELQNPDETWRPHARLGMNDRTYGQMDIAEPDITGIRVRLCLGTDETLCGEYGTAEMVEVRETKYSTAGLPIEGVIAIAIFAVLLAIAAIGLVIKCCFCSTPKPKKLTKDDIAGPNRLQNNHNTYNYDNKGVSAKDTADSPDVIKSQMYGYNYAPSVATAQTPAVGYDQSSSTSNNGGSVNSQDSLWNVKHPVTGMPVDPSVNGYIGAGYYGEQYTQQYNQYNQYNQPQQLQQQYNYEEYPHYPNPEEYIGDRNRAYYPNGDVYAMTNKSRSRLDSDYSPYGDVSGLPDPYTGHDISDELRNQDMSLSQDDSAPPPEGYSTPSRRVIREIIV